MHGGLWGHWCARGLRPFSKVKFIKVTEADRQVFVPVEEILFIKSKQSQTEIFFRNGKDSVTVKESLTEIIKSIHAAQSSPN